MARRGFWDSFYQGWEAGDKMGERFRSLAQRRDLGRAGKIDQETSEQYSPEQIAGLQDQAEQAGGQWSEQDQAYKMPDGGLQAPTNTPTWENGAYQTGQGQMVRPTKTYSLGGETRNSAYTPEEVRMVRANKIADVYDSYGDPEKANTLRAQADQLRLGKVQYENAARQADEAKNVNALMKLQQKKDTMTAPEFMNELVRITDPMNKDGITHGFKELDNGLFEVTEMVDNKVIGSKVVSPELAFKRALKYASPTMYQQITGEEVVERDFTFKQNRAAVQDHQWNQKFKQDGDQFDSTQSLQVALANQREALAYDELASRESLQRDAINERREPPQMNDLQRYQLDQIKQFDADKSAILSELDSGKITEQEANRRINRLGRKFGGGGLSEKPAISIKDQQAIMEEVVGEVSQNPQFKSLDEASKRALLEREFRRKASFYTNDGDSEGTVDYGALGSAIEEETTQGARGLQPTPLPPKRGPGQLITSRGGQVYELPTNPKLGLKGGTITPQRARELGYID
jgi:hypothetical protein